MQKYPNDPERSRPERLDGKEAARLLYGGPSQAKPSAKAAGDGASSLPPARPSEVKGRAATAKASYREHLRRRCGEDVPEAVVEAFEKAYELGREQPDQIEALITGLRAGTCDKQRDRCGGRT